MKTVMQTVSGRLVDLAAPVPEGITIRDIAHHLALINRFTGATALPYSVAQHSCVVAKIAEQADRHPLLALQALLHDAHEAYTGDISTPMKAALGETATVNEIQFALDTMIHAALGIPRPGFKASGTIHYADRAAFATEWRDMMPGQCPQDGSPQNFSIRPIPWHMAEEKFLKEFERLAMMAGIQPSNAFNPNVVFIA